MPSGIDFSWAHPDPAVAFRDGVRAAAGYLSYDWSKNWTAERIRAFHRAGIGVLLNWESQAGAPLEGAWQGSSDAAEAKRQADALIREVGYRPRNTLAIAFSCDTDTSESQRQGPIRAYYANTKRVLDGSYINGCYGEADLCDYLHAQGLTGMQWQTLAWSYGRISTVADFYQSGINHTEDGASVDFDEIRNAAQMGAWWPPNHPLDKPTGDITEGDLPMNDADKKWVQAQITRNNNTVVERIVEKFGRALVFGGRAGRWSHLDSPELIGGPNNGIYDRLHRLETGKKG